MGIGVERAGLYEVYERDPFEFLYRGMVLIGEAQTAIGLFPCRLRYAGVQRTDPFAVESFLIYSVYQRFGHSPELESLDGKLIESEPHGE